MSYPAGHRDKIRGQIVDSARRLFNRNGFENVSIDAIMAHAGLTRGAFYSYFESKSDLYAEVLGCFFTDPTWKNRWKGVKVDLASPDAGPQIIRAYLSRQHLEADSPTASVRPPPTPPWPWAVGNAKTRNETSGCPSSHRPPQTFLSLARNDLRDGTHSHDHKRVVTCSDEQTRASASSWLRFFKFPIRTTPARAAASSNSPSTEARNFPPPTPHPPPQSTANRPSL